MGGGSLAFVYLFVFFLGGGGDRGTLHDVCVGSFAVSRGNSTCT